MRCAATRRSSLLDGPGLWTRADRMVLRPFRADCGRHGNGFSTPTCTGSPGDVILLLIQGRLCSPSLPCFTVELSVCQNVTCDGATEPPEQLNIFRSSSSSYSTENGVGHPNAWSDY